MFDDASRTRQSDDPTRPGVADYVIATALLAVTSIAAYRLFDDRSAGWVAEAVPVEAGPAQSVIR